VRISCPSFAAQNWNDRLTTIAGGLPIENDGEVIGGVGVSGEHLRKT